jgi:hypothetical protein
VNSEPDIQQIAASTVVRRRQSPQRECRRSTKGDGAGPTPDAGGNLASGQSSFIGAVFTELGPLRAHLRIRPRKRRLTDAKEAVNLLKDKHLLLAVLRILKQIVPIRQTEAAELMIAMNRHHITLRAVTQRPPGPNSVPPDFGNGAPATASRN